MMDHKGILHLVSLGPGDATQITPACRNAIEESTSIVGYGYYLKWIEPWLAGKEVKALPLGQERERAQAAIDCARQGQVVSLVSGGDVGVYAMASAAFDAMDDTDTFDVRVHPGVTAALAGGALLGAPLSHDFATLSLSDLLCPWQWIEERASHLAMADLVVALYNVSSEERKEGVYRILEIFSRHKAESTKCGIVRNAYRNGQTIEIKPLGELKDEKYDMRTTLIIGNRFTKTRRGWLYTPRGYSGWEIKDTCQQIAKQKENQQEPSALQEQKGFIDALFDQNGSPKWRFDNYACARPVWLFGGTTDGNSIAGRLEEEGFGVVVSVATEYGEQHAKSALPGMAIIRGSIGSELRRAMLKHTDTMAIVDATHPYATRISTDLMASAAELNIPYLRFERESADIPICSLVFQNVEDAAKEAALSNRVLISTGSRHLEVFVKAALETGAEVFARIAPDEASLKKALSYGIKHGNICAMQGPFSEEFNQALLKQWGIDCMVTKESGTAGGYVQKAAAASALGIKLITLKRPDVAYPRVERTESKVVDWVKDIWMGVKQ